MATIVQMFLRTLRHPIIRYCVVGLGAFALSHLVWPRNVVRTQVVTVKEQVESHAQVETKECTSRESISYVYVPVKSPQAGCPDVVVPSPVVTGTTSGGGLVAEAGGTAGGVATVDAHPSVGTMARPDWRLSALVGVGPGGLGFGGGIDRRLFGPVSAGIFTIVPPSDPSKATVGGSLSISW